MTSKAIPPPIKPHAQAAKPVFKGMRTATMLDGGALLLLESMAQTRYLMNVPASPSGGSSTSKETSVALSLVLTSVTVSDVSVSCITW